MAFYKKSKYLNTISIEDTDQHLIYHSLFGNLKTFNESAINILNLYEERESLENLEQKHSKEDFETIKYCSEIFKDLYFICEDGLNERDIIQNQLKERKKKLKSGTFVGGIQLNVSNLCNFSCYYCFVNSTTNRRIKESEVNNYSDGKLMDFETAKKGIEAVMKILKKNGKENIVIKFFGREPMINWKIIDEIMMHFKRGTGNGIHINYAITTNGFFITDEIAKKFANNDVLTTVSIDGTEKANNAIRTQQNSNETFASIRQGLEYLKKNKVKTNLSAVVTEENFDYFTTDFIDFAIEYGAKEVQVLLGMQGDYIKQLTTEKIVDKLYTIHSYGLQNGVAVGGYWQNAFAQLFNTSFKKGDTKISRITDSCTATNYQVSIEPNGNIFPCKAMSMKIGNINNIEAMLENHPYQDVAMRVYGNVKDCHGCPIEGFCQGVCLGNIEEKFKNIYKVDKNYCDIYRGITKKILENL